MFIQTEQTPNPATLKFLPGRPVLGDGTAEFTGVEEAERSPLAAALFTIEGVRGVFLGSDFIAVTKGEDAEWHLLKPSILGAVMEHYMSGQPILLGAEAATAAEGGGEVRAEDFGEDADTVRQIKELIDTRVRPAVAQDGGDITFRGFDRGVVYLHLRGACSGCPSSTITLKNGIENMLRYYIPEVVEVRALAQ